MCPTKCGEGEGVDTEEIPGDESQKKKKKRRKNKKKKKKGAKQEGGEAAATGKTGDQDDGNQVNDKASHDEDDDGEDNESAGSADDLEFEEDLKQFSLRLQAVQQQQSSMLSSQRPGGRSHRKLRPNVSEDWLRTIREQCKNYPTPTVIVARESQDLP